MLITAQDSSRPSNGCACCSSIRHPNLVTPDIPSRAALALSKPEHSRRHQHHHGIWYADIESIRHRELISIRWGLRACGELARDERGIKATLGEKAGVRANLTHTPAIHH